MFLGVVVSIVALAKHAFWLLVGAQLLLGLSTFSTVVLGGDVFQLQALKDTVNTFHKENKLLERQNNDLEAKAAELGHLTGELAEVERQLGADLEAVQSFLKELESFTSIQSVSAMLNLFFAADMNRSGHISGTEADILFQGLTTVWALVPDLAPSRPQHKRLLRAVRHKGLSLRRFMLLARAAADGDAAALRAELEALAREGPRGEGSEILDEHVDSTSDTEDSSADEEKEALVPCFVLGPVQIWSKSHVVFLSASLLSLVLLLQGLLPFNFAKVLVAGADLGLSGSLTAYGKLVVVRKALREEMERFHRENERLAAANKDLSEKVAGLAKLQRGLKALQEQFHNCVPRAKSMLERSNSAVKMSAIGALMHLFAKVDADHNGALDESEVDEFVAGLEVIFHHVENLDVEEIRRSLKLNGLEIGQLKSLVDLILASGSPALAPAATVSAQPVSPIAII